MIRISIFNVPKLLADICSLQSFINCQCLPISQRNERRAAVTSMTNVSDTNYIGPYSLCFQDAVSRISTSALVLSFDGAAKCGNCSPLRGYSMCGDRSVSVLHLSSQKKYVLVLGPISHNNYTLAYRECMFGS